MKRPEPGEFTPEQKMDQKEAERLWERWLEFCRYGGPLTLVEKLAFEELQRAQESELIQRVDKMLGQEEGS